MQAFNRSVTPRTPNTAHAQARGQAHTQTPTGLHAAMHVHRHARSGERVCHAIYVLSLSFSPPPAPTPDHWPTARLSPLRQIMAKAWDRGRVLVCLMLLQSASSFILDYFQELLKENVIITQVKAHDPPPQQMCTRGHC